MPPYNRYRGERVSYSQLQTSLYKSQRIRWIKGLSYSPSMVIYQDDGTILLRYRSYRATDGFWETIFDPSGFLPGEEGNLGSAPVCGLNAPASCLSDRLAYARVTTAYSYTVEFLGGDETISFSDGQTVYILAPGGGVNPPRDGTFVFGSTFLGEYTGQYPEGCINGFLQPYQNSGETSTEVGIYFIKYDESVDKVYRYIIGSQIVSASDSEYANDSSFGGTAVRTVGYAGSIQWQFNFVNDEPIDHHSYCLPGNPGTPPDPDINRPLRYKCDCPDFTKQAQAMPWSRYTSELSDRLIPGNTHTGAIGPCKHVYSAGNVVGERFSDPATVNDPWTLQDYPPRTLFVDWAEPIPPTLNDDNNLEQLRAWREQRRTRRREASSQRTADYQDLQRRRRELKLANYELYYRGQVDLSRSEYFDEEAYNAWKAMTHPHIQDPDDPFTYYPQ